MDCKNEKGQDSVRKKGNIIYSEYIINLVIVYKLILE